MLRMVKESHSKKCSSNPKKRHWIQKHGPDLAQRESTLLMIGKMWRMLRLRIGREI